MKDEFQLWLDIQDVAKFGRAVLGWYRKHKRDLPWRKSPDAYRVWISEIMLQQTRIGTVIDYYHRFLDRFPDVQSLAAASVDEVLSAWEGLGYYRRARSLHAAAQVVVRDHAGHVPGELNQLQKLPGIGRYTAAAILSIANAQRVPILEGNTIRLHARLVACQSDIDDLETRKQLWSFAGSILPKQSPGDFNQALMDIGSTICRTADPDCRGCPVADFCETLNRGWQSNIPFRANKVEYEAIHETALIVNRRKKILVLQHGPDEWWSGLWDFPRVRSGKPANPSDIFPTAGNKRSVQDCLLEQFGLMGSLQPTGIRLKHAVTRFRITLDCLEVNDVSGRLKTRSTCKWQTLDQIHDLALTASARRIANQLLVDSAGRTSRP